MALSIPIHFNPAREGLSKALGPLEAEIMQILWQEAHSSVRQIHALLAQQRTIAYTTVLTTMRRLVDKGFLKRERAGNADIYRPALSQEDLVQMVVQQVLESLLDEHRELVVNYMISYFTERGGQQ